MKVILRNFCETMAAMESNKYYTFRLCVCTFSHSVCKARVPYYKYILSCVVWFSHSFPHFLIKGTTFEKEVIKHNIF